jgi:2-polyprenyl-3-methyl-5-hydroxy-6-metoxy-1,4-benzoquinol methylase
VLPCFEAYHRVNSEDEIEPVLGLFQRRHFDRILLLDILEHLTNPGRVLDAVKPLLKESGAIVVSVPNVANITVRLMLLFGRFEYTERGILDKTHVRFFTRGTARKMLHEHGYEIIEERMTSMPFELILGMAPSNPLMKVITAFTALPTKLLPGLLGYQTMFVARTRTSA